MDSISSPSARRTLVRQYKDSLRPMGVYVLRNLVTGGVLVAGSLDLDAAMNRLRFELRRGGHRTHPRLQEDWQRLGEGAFAFEVVQRLKERDDDPTFDYAAELAALLEIWQEELGACGPQGYGVPVKLAPRRTA